MNYIIDDQTLNKLNKGKGKIAIRFVIAFFLGGGLTTMLFIFQKPQYATLISLAVALVLTLMMGYIFFIIVEYLIPLKNYKKIIKSSYQSSHLTNDVTIIEIKEKSQHYLGNEITVIVAKEDDEKKNLYIYVLKDDPNPLEVGKSYRVETYHSFLIGYMEK